MLEQIVIINKLRDIRDEISDIDMDITANDADVLGSENGR